MRRGREVSLSLFITSVSGSKSVMSFRNRWVLLGLGEVVIVEVPQKKEISRKKRVRRRKEVDFTICGRRANRREGKCSTKREEFFSEMLTST